MKKLFLLLTIVMLSCQDSPNHYLDGQYRYEATLFNIQVYTVDYNINGSTIQIENSMSGYSELQCIQYKDRLEYTEPEGFTRVFIVLPNGDLQVSEDVIIKKISK